MIKKIKVNFVIKNIFSILIIFFVLFACEPAKVLKKISFNNDLFSIITINSNQKTINNIYEINFIEPYLDNTLTVSPLDRLNSWINNNIVIFGSQNNLIINIIEASLKRIERENKEKKKYSEKNEYLYEVIFHVEYLLHDQNDQILATTKVFVKRSTTSSLFISLKENENISESLIHQALVDVALKSEELLRLHMFDYVL